MTEAMVDRVRRGRAAKSPHSSIRLLLRGQLATKILENGHVSIETMSGDYLTLNAGQLMYLLAFATPRAAEEASTVAGIGWSSEVDMLTDALIDAGLLSIIGGAMQTGDARNTVARRLFSECADAWVRHSYEDAGPEHFTFGRIRHALRFVHVISNGKRLRVVDFGCGPGHLVVELALRGHTTCGIDSSEEMLRVCRERIGNQARNVARRIILRCGDVMDVPLRKGWDVVSALGLLAWFDEPTQVFSRARRLLVRGGYFIVDVANASVTPGGPAWMYADSIGGGLISFLATLTRLGGASDLHGASVAARSVAIETPDITEGCPDGVAPFGYREDPRRVAMERRYSPVEISRVGDETGFRMITLSGVGEVKTILDAALRPEIAKTFNEPLNDLQDLPISAAWSTGFVCLFEAV